MVVFLILALHLSLFPYFKLKCHSFSGSLIIKVTYGNIKVLIKQVCLNMFNSIQNVLNRQVNYITMNVYYKCGKDCNIFQSFQHAFGWISSLFTKQTRNSLRCTLIHYLPENKCWEKLCPFKNVNYITTSSKQSKTGGGILS